MVQKPYSCPRRAVYIDAYEHRRIDPIFTVHHMMITIMRILLPIEHPILRRSLCGFICISTRRMSGHPCVPIVVVTLRDRRPSLDGLKRRLPPVKSLSCFACFWCPRVVDDGPEIRVPREDEALADPASHEVAEGIEVS